MKSLLPEAIASALVAFDKAMDHAITLRDVTGTYKSRNYYREWFEHNIHTIQVSLENHELMYRGGVINDLLAVYHQIAVYNTLIDVYGYNGTWIEAKKKFKDNFGENGKRNLKVRVETKEGNTEEFTFFSTSSIKRAFGRAKKIADVRFPEWKSVEILNG